MESLLRLSSLSFFACVNRFKGEPMQYTPLLYSKLFRVRVPEISLLSDVELEFNGVHLPYDKIKDRIKKREEPFSLVEINIARMLEIYEKGMPILVVSRDDVYEIHKIIRHYIAESLEHNKQYNVVPVPNEELQRYEQFADEILELNRPTVIAPDIQPTRGSFNPLHSRGDIPITQEEWERVTVNKPTIPDDFEIPDVLDY